MLFKILITDFVIYYLSSDIEIPVEENCCKTEPDVVQNVHVLPETLASYDHINLFTIVMKPSCGT